jgi:SAM-dependent methyltransferase
VEADWYKPFFTGVALEFWRRLATPAQTAAEADFIASSLETSPGSLLLDVPCGNGRHALDLAGRGYRVYGVDLSEEFIGEARSQATMLGVPAEFALGDMRRLELRDRLAGAYCFGNSFGYLDPDGTRGFVEAVAGALQVGGRFVFETGMAAESLLPSLEPRDWTEVDGIVLLMENRYQLDEGRLDTDFTFIRDGCRVTLPSTHWVFTVAEIRRMLSAAGLTTIGLYGGLSRHPYGLGSPNLLVVAQKGMRSG